MKRIRFLKLLVKFFAALMIAMGGAGFAMDSVNVTAEPPFKLPMVTNVPWLPDGTAVHIDLPKRRHVKNTGGNDSWRDRSGRVHNPNHEPGKGSGLCVFTSAMMAADWHHIRGFNTKFQSWMTNHEGGGYPEKLIKMMREFAAENKIDMPDVMQNTNGDLDLLAEVIQKGFMPGCTYCKSPTGRYDGGTIAHMLNPVAGRAVTKDGRKVWAIVDNNYLDTWEWMEEADFARAFKGNGGGWFVIFVAPEPPPIPKNVEK